jgi:hypothetical protein
MTRSAYRWPSLLRNPATLAALTISAALTLAGCGSHSAEGTATSASPSQNSATPQTSEPPAQAAAPMAGPGLIELRCNQPMQLIRIDPATGATLAQQSVSFTYNSAVGTVFADHYSCAPSSAGAPPQLETREMFSQDFTKIMVTSGTQPDGSRHVGYVTLATGEFTDLTPAVSTSSGFGAAIPVLSSPIFDAATDHRWFIDDTADGRIYDCSSDTTCLGTVAEPGYPLSDGLRDVLHGVWQVTHGGDWPILSPNAALMAAVGNGGYGGLVISHPNHYASWINNDVHGAIVTSGGQEKQTYCAAWLTDTSILAQDSQDGSLYYVNGVKVGLSGHVTASLALPANKSTNTSYMASPDSTHFAFLSTATGATITEIYTETLSSNPPRPPAKVGEASSANDKLLAWQ